MIELSDILKDQELRTSLEKIARENPQRFIGNILNPNTMLPFAFYTFNLSYIYRGLNSSHGFKERLIERDEENNYSVSLGNFATFGEAYDKMLWFFKGLNNEGKQKLIIEEIEEDESSIDNPKKRQHKDSINYKITQIYGSGKNYLSFSYFVTISRNYNFIKYDKKIDWIEVMEEKREFKMKFRILSRADAIKFAKTPHDYKTIIISISNSYEYNKKLIKNFASNIQDILYLYFDDVDTRHKENYWWDSNNGSVVTCGTSVADGSGVTDGEFPSSLFEGYPGTSSYSGISFCF